jgi:hypothetical protein
MMLHHEEVETRMLESQSSLGTSTDPEESTVFGQADRVAAARDIDTTQGMHINKGEIGTVAEDRGSKLVVVFDGQAGIANLDDRDLRATDEPECQAAEAENVE